ncbi:MAG: helix-turn-helix domain-containing protein, partial [Patescibacteria group bacterium]
AYVALSRVRSGAGVFVERWSPSSIRAEPLVTQLYDSLAEEMKTYVPRPLYAPVSLAPAQKEEREKKAGTKVTRAMRSEQIRLLLERQASFDAIVATCGVKPERVVHYLESLLAEGLAPSLGYLIAEHPEAPIIRSAFEEHGTELLRPVFDALKEKIPYPTLRLVRCVMTAERS